MMTYRQQQAAQNAKRMIELHRQGLGARIIAARLHCSLSTVQKVLAAHRRERRANAYQNNQTGDRG